jgi:hypothetical protein
MAFVSLSAFVFTSGILLPQECHFVHPPPVPQPEEFPQPPKDGGTHFRGPVIRAFNVRCWTAEPSEPSKCIGGVEGFQKVTAFAPTSDSKDTKEADTSFHQQTLSSFSAGGATSDLKPANIPPGIFVSLKGHPIFKVRRVQYPIEMKENFVSPRATGVKVEADFEHTKTSGECYFYVAVWVAEK